MTCGPIKLCGQRPQLEIALALLIIAFDGLVRGGSGGLVFLSVVLESLGGMRLQDPGFTLILRLPAKATFELPVWQNLG